MTFWAIVVAAGSGSRFGAPKHTALISGRPLWELARSALIEAGASSVVVVGDVAGGVLGGARRRDSVAAGLAEIPSEVEFVLVHDAARPLATADLARRIASRIDEGDVDAAVPGIVVTDAIKQLDTDGRIVSVDRDFLRAVQTPQGFRASSLRAAHEAVEGDAADDAELIERWGGTVAMIDGETSNLKITYESDLAVAEVLLGAR
ncbi:MAG: 2-C-methyl-D-erythritol 4-phosphate cytidylyltransferase [Acidimicrobiia bacterium]|nr:2-C-methyl-D-erythritol 4-phosphate cytidylyltransferase [Acidimicrobiia bacterium]